MSYSEPAAQAKYRLWQIGTIAFPVLFGTGIAIVVFSRRGGPAPLAEDLWFLVLVALPVAIRLGASEIIHSFMDQAAPVRIVNHALDFPTLQVGLFVKNNTVDLQEIEVVAVAPPLASRARLRRLFLILRNRTILVRHYASSGPPSDTLAQTVRALQAQGIQIQERLQDGALSSLGRVLRVWARPSMVVVGAMPALVFLGLGGFLFAVSPTPGLAHPLIIGALELSLFPWMPIVHQRRIAVSLLR